MSAVLKQMISAIFVFDENGMCPKCGSGLPVLTGDGEALYRHKGENRQLISLVLSRSDLN